MAYSTLLFLYIFNIILLFIITANGELVNQIHSWDSTSPRQINNNKEIIVFKCCSEDQILIEGICRITKKKSTLWHPLFTSEKGEQNLQINYRLIIGKPNCGNMQLWPIFHYYNSTDKLRLLPNGILRHYFDNQIPKEFDDDNNNNNNYENSFIAQKQHRQEEEESKIFHDYEYGKYCLDKATSENLNNGILESEFAWICVPDHKHEWATNEFLMHNIINPITHGITIVCLLIIAIIYFIMPTLRDLTGNIVTTICMCLILSQIADLVRLLTVFKSHISLLITEAICYLSLLAAFFWLNSLGFYIWKTFRSRNVFLRITDGKKYCYYGGYAWTSTIILGSLALFAHFTMDYPDFATTKTTTMSNENKSREQIGSLGMIIFFVPVAFTVLADVFFFATTLKKINRMHTYGRIHHKLRHSFRMFILLLLTMTVCWLFFLSSFSNYEGLVNTHIIVNTFMGPLIFYICVINQHHVAYLLKKGCCYENCVCPCWRPEQETEWGDEMTAMNNTDYFYREPTVLKYPR